MARPTSYVTLHVWMVQMLANECCCEDNIQEFIQTHDINISPSDVASGQNRLLQYDRRAIITPLLGFMHLNESELGAMDSASIPTSS